jgi:hypothetical protein
MGYDFHTSATVKARKQHRCEHCRAPILPGQTHHRIVGKWQGDFYAVRAHEDCHQLWNALFSDWGDPWDGMPYDLPELFADSCDKEAAQEALDCNRGHFPHAVCRVEYRLRYWLSE